MARLSEQSWHAPKGKEAAHWKVMETKCPEQKTLIFLHIPKTAGITLNTIIEKQYSSEDSYSTSMSGHHPDGSLDGYSALTTERKAKLRLLYGHMGFGLHETLERPATYFAFLRDPIERVISHFYYESREPRGPLFDLIKSGKMDFDGYIHHTLALEMDNLQTRMISGNWNKRGFGKCDERMLGEAKRNLREHFTVVGLTEKFDQSYLLLRKAFGWRREYYAKKNVTNKRPKQNDISASSLSLVRRSNEFDAALHRYASELLDSQIERQGPQFWMELKLFQYSKFARTCAWRLYVELRKPSVRTFIKQRLHQNS